MRLLAVLALSVLLSGCSSAASEHYRVEAVSLSGSVIPHDQGLAMGQVVASKADKLCTEFDREKTSANASPGTAASCEGNLLLVAGEEGEVHSGTGYLVDDYGHILTNAHVVDECRAITLISEGYRYKAMLVAIDNENDLALVDGAGDNLVPVKFRQGKYIRVAEGVVAIGYPYAGLLSSSSQTTLGTVTSMAGVADDQRFLQISAPIQPGNSGGPLFDMAGNVVGTIVATINPLAIAKATGSLPQNINFAIKENVIIGFLDRHDVRYFTANSSRKIQPADVSEQGVKSTVMIECRS
jgi:S1-C subfamily serine protease